MSPSGPSKQRPKRCVGVLYPGSHGPPVMAHKSRYDRLPPAANGWGTKHPIPDMVRPLLVEEEGVINLK
jgi:hypothetical protein